jgi:hypothetical protein
MSNIDQATTLVGQSVGPIHIGITQQGKAGCYAFINKGVGQHIRNKG